MTSADQRARTLPDPSRRRYLGLAGSAVLVPLCHGLPSAWAAGGKPADTLQAPARESRPDLMSHFTRLGVDGTFALYDVGAHRLVLVDDKRADTRMVPASTYKIPNSLIALETGVVKDLEQVLPYGGGPARFKQWERDMAMPEAIRVSNVPIYQGIARRVGMARMQQWVDRLDYGNRRLGTQVDQFWLRGPLEISAVEQTRFLARLARGTLPASQRSQQWVREICRVETVGDRALYAKTGWAMDAGLNHGWWVGWVEGPGTLHTFALNMDLPREELAPHRFSIARAMLAEFGVLPSPELRERGRGRGQ